MLQVEVFFSFPFGGGHWVTLLLGNECLVPRKGTDRLTG